MNIHQIVRYLHRDRPEGLPKQPEDFEVHLDSEGNRYIRVWNLPGDPPSNAELNANKRAAEEWHKAVKVDRQLMSMDMDDVIDELVSQAKANGWDLSAVQDKLNYREAVRSGNVDASRPDKRGRRRR